VTLFIWA